MNSKQLFRTILVIGNKPDEIIKKYSANTLVQQRLYVKKEDASKLKEKHISILKESLKTSLLNNSQKQITQTYIDTLTNMEPLTYFYKITEGCEYDTNGDAFTVSNPNAYYQNERSPQKIFEKTGEETGFCTPFKVKGDNISYSAYKGDIEWYLIHKNNQEVYARAWDLVVNDDEPANEQEKNIKSNMSNRFSYFENFKDKMEYVNYSTCFWTYGVATNDSYEEIGMNNTTDKDWVVNFYDNYIKDLSNDTLLTIYEVQAIDNI